MRESGDMYAIVVYVPEAAAEAVKAAMFSAGAGRIGNYDSCCWQTEGQGQFRPLQGSQPSVGELDQLECVREIRVEMVCEEAVLKRVLDALLDSHPYETPAFHYWPVNRAL